LLIVEPSGIRYTRWAAAAACCAGEVRALNACPFAAMNFVVTSGKGRHDPTAEACSADAETAALAVDVTAIQQDSVATATPDRHNATALRIQIPSSRNA
jgi:hypothetical protein